MKAIDLSGQRFGRLVVLARDGSSPRGGAKWRCRCDCGTGRTVLGTSLRSARTVSCGCFVREHNAEIATTHGLTDHPLYRIRSGMLFRCHNPKSTFFHRYGGRGIEVCPVWRASAATFIEWALANGWQPGLTIDRINNDGNYEPANCRFVSRGENARKRSDKSTWRRSDRPGAHNREKTTCPKGHPLDGVQVRKTRTMRFCFTCRRAQSKQQPRRRSPRKVGPHDKSGAVRRLSFEQIQDARALWNAGGVTQRALAARFKVSAPTMNKILRTPVWEELRGRLSK